MKRLLSMASMLVLALSLTACGADSKKIVTNVEVETDTQDGILSLEADFELALGAAMLPTMSLPLADGFGSLSLFNEAGVNHAVVDVNLTKVLSVPAGDGTLPNGNMIPVNTDGAGVLEIPVKDTKSRVYIAFSGDTVMVGFAVSISQLDDVPAYLGSIGVFPSFNIGEVPVTAGVFTSSEPGKNGIAAFANISGALGSGAKASEASAAFEAVDQNVPYWKERVLGRRLLKIKRIEQVLEVAR